MMYEQFGQLKYKHRNQEFWCKGYYVDTAGKNAERIAEYISNQQKKDKLGKQLCIPEASPFKGRKQLYAFGGLILCVYTYARNRGLARIRKTTRLTRGYLIVLFS